VSCLSNPSRPIRRQWLEPLLRHAADICRPGRGCAFSKPLSPNYALQRSWTHKLHGARTAVKLRTRLAVCAVTGRRAAAELRR
jgi:hypothetical protein